MNLTRIVENASQIISSAWSLKTFIARNPLEGLEHLPFEQALKIGDLTFDKSHEQEVNREMVKWCQAFYDREQAVVSMPNKEKGFYAAWLSLAKYDKHLKHKKSLIKRLPESPIASLRYCLEELQIREEEWESYLRHVLTQLPGWSAYIKGNGYLIDYLAVRLAITAILTDKISMNPPKKNPKYETLLTEVKIKEKEYQEQLIEKLTCSTKRSSIKGKPDAQLVFCIDVRSEPIRRRIERIGNYETFGFAGFFALPIRVHKDSGEAPVNSCPILVKPEYNVFACSRKNKQSLLKTLYKNLKYQFGTAFALVESTGSFCGLAMIWKMAAPRMARIRARIGKKLSIVNSTALRDPVKYDLGEIPFEKRVLYAENLLRGLGLTRAFSRWVVFCGHGSSTTNNPFASTLDCGACGGNKGSANAQIAAEILNSSNVREQLRERGIPIPNETTFISILHNTTTDRFHFLDLLPEDEILATLKKDLLQIGEDNVRSRLNARCFSAGVRRSNDWSEAQPEWGLARNASFIAADRELTYGVDLEGRSFLHSYDWKQDGEGRILEGILTGPLVVAFKINCQYFFSTFDTIKYGAGDKMLHNVTGKIGIVQGNASDLKLGLPLQSVFASEDSPYHEPIRLLAVVQAPLERVRNIVGKHDQLQKLVRNEWIFLKVFDPETLQIASV